MFSLKSLTLIFALLFCLSQQALAQDIGILSEPPKKKTPEKPTTRKPTPPPRKNEPVAEKVEKPKRKVMLTIISDPIECEIYINDIYRGTTASLSGKLVVPDLDPSISYSLRIYKRGIGEELQTLNLNQDQELRLSLRDKLATNGSPEKNNPPENIATNTSPTKEPDKPTKEPDKQPEKQPDKQPDKPANTNPIATNTNNPSNPTTTSNPSTVALNNNPSNSTTNNANNTATKPVTKPIIAPPQREMVLIPSGEVNIGSNVGNKQDNFKPQHRVNVVGFYIDVYEVNNADYKLFCDATGRAYPPNPSWDKEYFLTKPNYPVLNVTWDDANAYAFWVGKRLPTEEEWEKAARGVESLNWPWGKDHSPSLTNLGGPEDGFEYTAPIGNFPTGKSPYGLQDMVGNVWEWTSSAYKPYPGGPDDKRYSEENEKYRVIRGGGYNVKATGLRTAAFRFPGELKERYEGTGFRCAKSQ